MSVVSVNARSFILALFIRDDGERFLLGDKGFDFKDSQLHFSANTIENDEVAKQGVDGVMLAGQVRRASVQSFDGYIGDGSTLKEEVEQMRRDFIAFFAKGHHFRVIYIDCNRNAWQRKGGYLVDAPEVKELWQIHPEYHVGLNFEDVNYYEYDENAEGEEILSNIISVPISSDVEGGLVWDENGAVSEPEEIEYDTETATASGTNISISDAVAAPLSDFKLKGETSQNGTPTPDAPVAVQTVTGENVVKISDGQGNEQSYEVNLGKNLYDKSASTDGKRLAANGEEYSDNTFTLSAYIPVEPNTKYTLSGMPGSSYGHVATYDSSKTFVGRWYVGSDPYTFTTQANAKYIRIAIPLACKDTTQCELGTQATSYAAYFTPIELCKMTSRGVLYQDYLYKSENKWYVHKAVGKQVVDTSTITLRTSYSNVDYGEIPKPTDSKGYNNYTHYDGMYCTHSLIKGDKPGGWNQASAAGYIYDTPVNVKYWAGFAKGTSLDVIKTTLAGCIIYYPLATPTDTEITNATLIEQLEAILSQGSTYAGTNNITTIISAGNAQGELEITYYTKYDAKVVGGGYVWEAGGSGGPTIVTNESISAVSPVWTVFGPALNPMLENTTTGEQIQYVDMISEGQTLVVDMGEQTASLDGLNVISNIVGEYLTLAPGSNTLLFSADSDAPASEIGWSEIVG